VNPFPILAAACTRNERRLQLLVYGLFLLVAVAMAAWLPRQRRLGEIMALLLMLPTFFLWMGWFSRVLLLRAHARSLRIPRLAQGTTQALLAAVLSTVVAPALLMSAVGAEPAWAAASLACVAAAGLLLALLPRGLAGLLGFVPMLSGVLGGDAVVVLVDWHAAMPAFAALLALLAAWRWQRVSSDIDRWNDPDWQQPLVFAMARRRSAFGGADLLDAKVQEGMVPRWLRQGADLRSLRPGQARLMRTLLGGVFTPVGWKQLGVTIAVYLGILLMMVHYFDHDGSSPWQMVMFMCLFAGGLMLMWPFALRLQGLQQEHGGEMAELALLPGWGDAAQARATLVRAVLQVYGRVAVLLLLLMGVAAAMTGDPLVLALALVSALAVAVLGVVSWLRPLSGERWTLKPWHAVPIVLLGSPLVGATVVAYGGGALVLPMLVAWALLLVAALQAAASRWRRFEARPQPFLMY
jgi:hypothetical protein